MMEWDVVEVEAKPGFSMRVRFADGTNGWIKFEHKTGNIRDHAMIEQLVVLSNLESINAELIRKGIAQSDQLAALNQTATHQMRSLLGMPEIRKLK